MARTCKLSRCLLLLILITTLAACNAFSSKPLAVANPPARTAQALAASGQQEAAARQYRSAFGLIPELLDGLELMVGLQQQEAAVERRKLEQRLARAVDERRRLEQQLEAAPRPGPAAGPSASSMSPTRRAEGCTPSRTWRCCAP